MQEDILQEIETLKEIYLNELTVIDNNSHTHELRFNLSPATGEKIEEKWVSMLLCISPMPEYPLDIPCLKILNPRGLLEEHTNRIIENLKMLAQDRIGFPMIFDLVELAKEMLTKYNVPHDRCMICLEDLSLCPSPCFVKTRCLHYFHRGCLRRYVDSYAVASNDVIVCPICREDISENCVNLDNENDDEPEPEDFVYAPDAEMILLQARMKEMIEVQRAKGGIIDEEVEKKKYDLPKDFVYQGLKEKELEVKRLEAEKLKKEKSAAMASKSSTNSGIKFKNGTTNRNKYKFDVGDRRTNNSSSAKKSYQTSRGRYRYNNEYERFNANKLDGNPTKDKSNRTIKETDKGTGSDLCADSNRVLTKSNLDDNANNLHEINANHSYEDKEIDSWVDSKGNDCKSYGDKEIDSSVNFESNDCKNFGSTKDNDKIDFINGNNLKESESNPSLNRYEENISASNKPDKGKNLCYNNYKRNSNNYSNGPSDFYNNNKTVHFRNKPSCLNRYEENISASNKPDRGKNLCYNNYKRNSNNYSNGPSDFYNNNKMVHYRNKPGCLKDEEGSYKLNDKLKNNSDTMISNNSSKVDSINSAAVENDCSISNNCNQNENINRAAAFAEDTPSRVLTIQNSNCKEIVQSELI